MIGTVFVMGPAGCGKTTLGRGLAGATGAVYLEGDAFHPPENVAAMSAGRALNDDMRRPWLAALGAAAGAEARAGRACVAACSALRRSYRDQLRAAAGPCRFLFLDAPEAALAARVASRPGHYMPASLVVSQIATLEVPGSDEADALRLDALLPEGELLAAALEAVSR